MGEGLNAELRPSFMIPETTRSFKGFLSQRTCSESLGIWLHEEATGKLPPPDSFPDKEEGRVQAVDSSDA